MHEKNDNDQAESLLQLVSFRVDSEEYGIDILKVQEIIRTVEITRVPRAPHYILGVINLRGKIIPVIDLRQRFGLEACAHDKDTRIVVVDVDGNIVGMVVDAVSEILRLPSGRVVPPPDAAVSTDSDYIAAVAKLDDRLLILLDLAAVINIPELDTVS